MAGLGNHSVPNEESMKCCCWSVTRSIESSIRVILVSELGTLRSSLGRVDDLGRGKTTMADKLIDV
jgi:hypothetical protein